MSRFRRPCIDCGELTQPGYSRCPRHQARIDELNNLRRQQVKQQTGQYSGNYQRLAKIVRQTAYLCHICGEGARHGDPWEADHLNPSTPVTSLADLAPAHRRCNQARSNKPL